MGNKEHMGRIQNSTVEEWNRWRTENLRIQPDLTRIDLSGRDLSGIDFRGVGLFKANLSKANLTNAILRQAIAIKTNFDYAILTGAHVYGISAWDVTTKNAIQKDLVVTEPDSPVITIDDLKLAQFIHLLINNKNIRDIIQVIGNKAILILGRFTASNKEILDSIREELRNKDYVPILFDFGKPSNRDITETVVTLAHLSKYIIADLTDAQAVPQELNAIIPNLPSVKLLPILRSKSKCYSMFEHFKKYPWVLDIVKYNDKHDLINNFDNKILGILEGK